MKNKENFVININRLIKEYHQLLRRLAVIEEDFYTDLDGKLCHLCDIEEARPEYLTVTNLVNTIKKQLEAEKAQEELKNFSPNVLDYIPLEVELEELWMRAEQL